MPLAKIISPGLSLVLESEVYFFVPTKWQYLKNASSSPGICIDYVTIHICLFSSSVSPLTEKCTKTLIPKVFFRSEVTA